MLLLISLALSCGGVGGSRPSGSGADPICDCAPSEPEAADFRHMEKHVPLPGGQPQEIDVNTVLSWAPGPDPAFDAPRTGRENQLFHIAQAFLQAATIMPDCDIHLEISQTADKAAPRMIAEVPVDAEYCTNRASLDHQLAGHNFTLSTTSGELDPPLAIEVLGLAFRDFEHNRGSQQVATPWELHPATANLLQ